MVAMMIKKMLWVVSMAVFIATLSAGFENQQLFAQVPPAATPAAPAAATPQMAPAKQEAVPVINDGKAGDAPAQPNNNVVTAAAPIETLPAATEEAPAVPLADPLASFRKAMSPDKPAAGPDEVVPTPTPGGFQQPVAPVMGDAVDLQLESAKTDEERALELEQKAKEQAFDSALNGMMPMTPDQIKALLDKYKVTRQASEERIGGMPKPEIKVQTVSLDPGTEPPVIKLSPGHVTSVTMLDMTGQPWPIQNVSWGGNFEVISPEEGGHLIRVSPLAAHEVGNMSVQLVNLKTPVTFTLETQLDVVQYRFDARIPEMGPLATAPIIDPGVTTTAGSDKALVQVLDGTPPAGTIKMRVEGVDPRTSVFKIGESTYLRTPLTLLSPGWSASVRSADGMTVYAVNNSPVFLLSDRGKMVRAMVQENKAEQ